MTKKAFVFLAVSNLFFNSIAYSADRFSAAQISSPSNSTKIDGLNFGKGKVRIDDSKGDGTRYFAIVEGTFSKKDWVLLHDNRKINLKDGVFRFQHILPKKKIILDFTAVGPQGEIQNQIVEVVFSDWEKEMQKATPRRLYIVPGLGVTRFLYKERNNLLREQHHYNALSLTGKLALNYLLIPPKWDLGTSIYATLKDISKNNENIVYNLGFNLRLGYVLPIKYPWRLSMYFGYYYMTMFVYPKEDFGVQNINGPQLYPAIQRRWSNGSAVSLYFKYSPISNNIAFLRLNSREMATGLSFSRVRNNGTMISISADYANVRLEYDTFKIYSKALSLGVGYGF